MKNLCIKSSILVLVLSLAACFEPPKPRTSTSSSNESNNYTPAKLDYKGGPVDYKIAAMQANASAKLLKFRKKDQSAEQFRIKYRELIITMLAEPSVAKRRNAAKTIGDLRKSAAYKPLSIAISDPNPSVRQAVVRALGQIGQIKGAFVLANSISDDKDQKVRLLAAISLAKLKNPKTSSVLRKHINSNNPKLAIACIRGLGDLRDKKSADELCKVYNSSKNTRIRATIISAIGQIIPQNANAILTAALTDTAELVRYQALCALGKIGSKSILPKIKPLLKDYNTSVRKAAANAIKQINARN